MNYYLYILGYLRDKIHLLLTVSQVNNEFHLNLMTDYILISLTLPSEKRKTCVVTMSEKLWTTLLLVILVIFNLSAFSYGQEKKC